MTCDLYLTILVEVLLNHMLAENTYFMNHTSEQNTGLWS